MDNSYTGYDGSLYNEIRSFFHDGEQILWLGKPCQSANVPTSPFLVIFSIFWLGFAVFWTVTAASAGGAFGLFGIPFLCIGVYLVYTVTVGKKRKLERTVYAVTDRRAMIVYHGYNGSACTDYYFNHHNNVSLSQVKGSIGTICFEQAYDGYHYGGYGHRYRGRPIGYEHKTSFIMIDNVHDVYRIISERISEK